MSGIFGILPNDRVACCSFLVCSSTHPLKDGANANIIKGQEKEIMATLKTNPLEVTGLISRESRTAREYIIITHSNYLARYLEIHRLATVAYSHP
jgi:hypothetical protein